MSFSTIPILSEHCNFKDISVIMIYYHLVYYDPSQPFSTAWSLLIG